MRRATGLALLACLSAAFGGAGSGHAQRTEPPPDTIGTVQLDSLVVSVLRSPLDIDRAPFAISVVGEERIQRARPGLALDEALIGIPGVQVDNRFNYALGERISIRGFGARTPFGVRGVKVLLDGIPATLPDGQTTLNQVDLGSVGRVEVIRGPASALYGNAAGGVIQLETETPPAVPFAPEATVVGGADGLRRWEATVAGTSGRAGYRVSASRLRYDGFRDFNAADNLRANALLTVGGERGDLRVTANLVDYDAQNPGSLSDSLLAVDRRQAFAFNRLQQTGEEGRQAQLGVRLRRDVGAGEVEVSGYAVARRLDNPIPPLIIDLRRRGGGVRALFRSHLPLLGREVAWTVGAEADLQRDGRLNFRNEEGERGERMLDQDERVTSRAVFAQAIADLGGGASVLGGVRHDRFRFAVEDRLISAADPDDSGRRTLRATSPALGLTVRVAPAVNVYGNVATAFETPTTTELANRPDGAGGFNPDLRPQRTLSYEAGARGSFGWVARYGIAVYRARVRDALIPFEVPEVPGRQFFRNAGSAVHRGLEIGATLAPFRGAEARLAYTHIDARFDRYRTAADTFDSNRVPGVAPHRWEAALAYQAPAGWYAEMDGRYVASIPVDDRNRAASPAYGVLDARGGLPLRSAGAEIAPFVGVTNLLDRKYNASVVVNAFGGRFYEPAPGRSVYLGASVPWAPPSD